MTINQICSEFNILGKFVGVEQLDTGNINCTYKVTYQHNGDVYFKTKYPGHNLDRARNQIALAKDWLMKKELLNDIVKKYF